MPPSAPSAETELDGPARATEWGGDADLTWSGRSKFLSLYRWHDLTCKNPLTIPLKTVTANKFSKVAGYKSTHASIYKQ